MQVFLHAALRCFCLLKWGAGTRCAVFKTHALVAALAIAMAAMCAWGGVKKLLLWTSH